MTSSWQLEVKMKAKKKFLRQENGSTYSYYKYGRLVVFIRNDLLRYGGLGMDSHFTLVL